MDGLKKTLVASLMGFGIGATIILIIWIATIIVREAIKSWKEEKMK